MTISVMIKGKDVMVAMRAEGKGDTVGDLFRPVKPGGEFFGVTYDELMKLGSGQHTIKPKK